MKITYLEPLSKNKRRVERVFGCSYANYLFPNIYVLAVMAALEKKYEVRYDQRPLRFPDDRSLKEFITSDKSDIYLIFSVNLSMEDDIAFSKRLLERNGDKLIIFLGPAPTIFPDRFLINSNTYVVRGEPDLTAPELVDALAKKDGPEGIGGVSYLKNGAAFHNAERALLQDLDLLPFPARHLVKNDSFYNPKLGLKPFTAMLTSRGCSYRCIYCVPCALNFAAELEFKKFHRAKPPARFRSASNVIEEFELIKKTGFRAVSIIDDQFIWDRERALEICDGIKDLKLAWGCLSRADRLDEDIVKRMKDSGCQYVDIGVESFVQEILDYVKKDTSVEKILDGIRLLKAHGIRVKLNILFGASPLETKESIGYTLKRVKELGPDQVMFDICSPFPGTEFYEVAKREGWIPDGPYEPVDVARSANISYDHLSSGELRNALRTANLNFLFNPQFMIKNAARLKNPFSIAGAVTAALRKLF
ncbi:MAG: radical SAM protein [Candidatus Omnitrophica bacterium]|nr:radical SAM protein [Candidatus Omnitrophota bacterium]